MKKPQKFLRNNKTLGHDELLDLCELFGNAAEGVSALSLGKILYANNVRTIQQLKDISISDILKFEVVGPKRITIFMAMKRYLEVGNINE